MEIARLTVVHDEGEAEIVCGLLRAAGIACSYRKTDTAAAAALGSFASGGPIEILVAPADLADAEELIRPEPDSNDPV